MSPRILWVDDDSFMIKVFSTLMEKIGYRDNVSFVEGKQAGSQAIELIKNERYDIVLTDRKMPGNDGWKVVEAIRAADSYRGKKMPTPVLMVRFFPLCCDLLRLSSIR